MARQLRKKIQSIITEEDILEIELQDYSRKLLKSRISDQKKEDSIFMKFSMMKILKDYLITIK